MGRFVSVVLVMMLVMMTTGPMVSEGRSCQSLSHRFKGPCASDHNCASICHTEGFSGGDCKGFRRRCFCTKHC